MLKHAQAYEIYKISYDFSTQTAFDELTWYLTFIWKLFEQMNDMLWKM